MQIKKTAIVTVFVSAIFVSANFMVAKAYEPLVRIPGLPAAGPINLSQYIVGLYNFLLSIVGIVAVMMLIIGGIKYIAAAGNASVISDAKDTIWNAIFGLLLALLSWVIVSTINPDVLYIKHPASSIIGNEFENDLSVCGVYDGAVCTCKDGTTPFAVDQLSCETACADNCGLTEPLLCIERGSIKVAMFDIFGGHCACVDGAYVTLTPAALGPPIKECNEVCQDPAFVTDGDYHCYVADFRIGQMNSDGNTLPDDRARAKKYALYQPNSYEYAYVISANDITACHMAFNAADYVTEFSDLVSLSYTVGHDPAPNVFNIDCATAVTVDLLAPPSPTPVPGYYAPQVPSVGACGVGDINSVYARWEADVVNCRKVADPESVICPIRLCADWNGGIHQEKTLYVQMLKP